MPMPPRTCRCLAVSIFEAGAGCGISKPRTPPLEDVRGFGAVRGRLEPHCLFLDLTRPGAVMSTSVAFASREWIDELAEIVRALCGSFQGAPGSGSRW